jgi:hypothetical protein
MKIANMLLVALLAGAHSTAKCNGEIFGVEEHLTRSLVAEYLSGARVYPRPFGHRYLTQ